jgi:hypothetical protein
MNGSAGISSHGWANAHFEHELAMNVGCGRDIRTGHERTVHDGMQSSGVRLRDGPPLPGHVCRRDRLCCTLARAGRMVKG